jgi:predicted NBD/HSP70 family sugar kinase
VTATPSRKPSLLEVPPALPAPLDPGYRPAFLGNRSYRAAAARNPARVACAIALERENGLVTRRELEILPSGVREADTLRYVERTVKFLLWANGGWKLVLGCPAPLAQAIAGRYRPGGERAFDADTMQRSYGRALEVVRVPVEAVPQARLSAAAIGRHLEGCRIGFDLGASDLKVAAVVDGNAVFSAEIPWNPSVQTDPRYHVTRIRDGLRIAAEHLPRVDAIGGSSAGIFVSNQPRVASLFRAVPPAEFDRVIRPMFLDLQKEWGVPLVVVNDGDVTALAGAMSLGRDGLLGIAMGSSEAGGYLDPAGRITGWLVELAFAPVDFNPDAAADEWSGDRGVGAQYFSQQAVARLAPAAGYRFPEAMPLPERLKDVQARAQAGDEPALRIFETLGVYLGYTVPHYADFFDFEHVLVLGRVTSGAGGEVLVRTAREVLQRAFPELAPRLTLHVPDEKARRVGQAVAAASLPELARR